MSHSGRILNTARRRRQLMQVLGSSISRGAAPTLLPPVTQAPHLDPAHTEKHGSVTVVQVGPDDGSLQHELLDRLRHYLLGCAQDAEPAHLVVDLSETEYFGGEFMGILCRCLHKVRGRHGEFALCGARPQLLEELRVARLDRLCRIYATREDAINAMEQHFLTPVP